MSLGNVLSAAAPKEAIPFIRDEDQDVYNACKDEAFEVQVGIHELLGHGCGKLLQETESGQYNFDVLNPPLNPVTGEKVATWYKPGETWGSVFGGMGPSYEECRAESVAMALCPDYKILEIFGYGNGEEVSNVPSSSSRAHTLLTGALFRISTVKPATCSTYATSPWHVPALLRSNSGVSVCAKRPLILYRLGSVLC